MDDEYDLLKLFTAACLMAGKPPQDAVDDAKVAAALIEDYMEEQLDMFGGDSGSE
jgi:hypothetical protein